MVLYLFACLIKRETLLAKVFNICWNDKSKSKNHPQTSSEEKNLGFFPDNAVVVEGEQHDIMVPKGNYVI